MTQSASLQCNDFAVWLKAQALLPAAMAAFGLVAAPLAMLAAGIALTGSSAVLLSLALLCGLVTLALSALIHFDASLFLFMASHGEAGGAAVDDLLARMRLKPLPAETRPLDSRMAGARRLVLRQRLAFAAFAAALLLMPVLR